MVVNVYRPNGVLLANTTCHLANSGCDLNLSSLEAGVHGVEVVPLDSTQTMTFNATVSRDLVVNMTRGTPTALVLPRHGQNARLVFPASASEVIALKITAQTTEPMGAGVYFRALRPDGTTIASGYAAGEKTLLIDTNVAGTYQVFVDPEHGATTTSTLTLEAGVLGEMEQDGSIGEYQKRCRQGRVLHHQCGGRKAPWLWRQSSERQQWHARPDICLRAKRCQCGQRNILLCEQWWLRRTTLQPCEWNLQHRHAPGGYDSDDEVPGYAFVSAALHSFAGCTIQSEPGSAWPGCLAGVQRHGW